MVTAPQAGPSVRWILGEWQIAAMTEDLATWKEGLRRFEAAELEDFAEMRVCAELMCAALTHYLAGSLPAADKPGTAAESQITQTIWNVLLATIHGNDETTWGEVPERHLRLVLACVRRRGIQSVRLGGNGLLAELFDDPGSQMLLTAALWGMSVSGPKDFTLEDWFAAEF